ncbi:MAG: winged helix-turn-helix transcriptional regulator [Euryarchaeota archaeon]|nr:winged helix-turn-helix transcriptional regulator [Euryarchaeota archaeon]
MAQKIDREILMALYMERRATSGILARRLRQSQSYVSQRLTALRRAGMVAREGTLYFLPKEVEERLEDSDFDHMLRARAMTSEEKSREVLDLIWTAEQARPRR